MALSMLGGIVGSLFGFSIGNFFFPIVGGIVGIVVVAGLGALGGSGAGRKLERTEFRGKHEGWPQRFHRTRPGHPEQNLRRIAYADDRTVGTDILNSKVGMKLSLKNDTMNNLKEKMMEIHLKNRDITDESVLDAMRKVDRSLFAPVGVEVQNLVLVEKTGESTFREDILLPVRFVPMTGQSQNNP